MYRRLHWNRKGRQGLLIALGIFFLLMCRASIGIAADEEVVTITPPLIGSVTVNGVQQATDGTQLKAGDTIETAIGASATLMFPDGHTKITVGDEEKITRHEIKLITNQKSKLQVWRGRLRAWLSFKDKQPGASFEFETGNALIIVEFSQPYIEVVYEPGPPQITTVHAYTVDVKVMKLKNGVAIEARNVPKGYSTIVEDDKPIQIFEIHENVLLRSRQAATGTISKIPDAVILDSGETDLPKTSRFPLPGIANAFEGTGSVVFGLTVDEER